MLAYFGNPAAAPAHPTRAARRDPATKAHEGTPHYGNFGWQSVAAPAAAAPPAPSLPIRPKAATIGAPAPSEAEIRAAFAHDDPRYAGGNPFDLSTEQTGL